MKDPNVKNTIIFNASKNELFKLNENYKIFHRKLKGSWKVTINREQITQSMLEDVKVLIIPTPQDVFTDAEFSCLKQFVSEGGSVLVTLTDGGEDNNNTNINFFLEEYGVVINNDCAVRVKYNKYFHPKQCLVANGIVNRAIVKAILKMPNYKPNPDNYGEDPNSPMFIYPHGATLNVKKPSTVVLSSGEAAYPVKRPLASFYKGEKNGKLVVFGSGHFFDDQYIEQECNDHLREIVMGFLTSTSEIQLHPVDADDPDINVYRTLPDTVFMSEILRPCLTAGDEGDGWGESGQNSKQLDFTAMFDMHLFSFNYNNVPDAIELYSLLGLKHEPLKLIKPQLETPLPVLQVAVFPPTFRELPPPPLELFDLDDAFSSETSRLAQLTNKCLVPIVRGKQNKPADQSANKQIEADLEYFVRECGRICKVGNDSANLNAKQILNTIGLQIAQFKKIGKKD
ncbi:intraflagellar transport 52 [Arctopsyche grandis]|uniref:intraflagellar transport 52 n=1 Tax=Arctopsyche grandis TaxID=121162 RepID=UPI00406D68AF